MLKPVNPDDVKKWIDTLDAGAEVLEVFEGLQAHIEKLEEMLASAFSGYVGGSGHDNEWHQRRDALLNKGEGDG